MANPSEPGVPPALDFNQILSYDAATGILATRGTRVVLMPTTLMSSLRRSLLEAYPHDQVRARYWKAGFEQGFQDAISIAQTIQIEDEFDFVKLGSALTAPAGRARMDIEKADFRLLEGQLSVRVRFHSSYEAIDHLRHFGTAREGVCWVLCGYAQGFVEALFDKPIIVLEYQCQAMGHPDCALVLTTDPAEADALSSGREVPPSASPAEPLGPSISNEQMLSLTGKLMGAERERFATFFARKDAELERSRLKYRALFDASPDAVFEVNGEGRVLLANERTRSMLGAAPQDLLGAPVASLFVPEDRGEIERLFPRLGKEAVAVLPRLRIKDPAGATRFVELVVKAIGSGATAETAVAEIRDVTERTRLEGEIREREGRLRAIFEAAADGIIVWGEDGRIAEVNAAAERILGYKPGTLAGAPIDGIVISARAVKRGKRGEAAGSVVAKGLSAVRLSKRWVGDVDLQRKTGERRPVIMSISPLKGLGTERAYLALIKDSAEVESLREELKSEQEKLAAVVGAIADPLVIFGPDNDVEWANDHSVFSFGRKRVVRGTPCHLLVCDEPGPCHTCPVAEFARQAQSPGTVRVRRNLRTTEGTAHPYELTLRRVPSPHGHATTLAIFRDIAEESGSEMKLRERLRRDDLNLELSDMLLSSRTVSAMLERFGDRLASALSLTTVAVLLRGSTEWLAPAVVFHGGAVLTGIPSKIPPGTVGIKEVLATGEPRLVRDVEKSAGGSRLVAVLERAGAPASGTLYLTALTGRSANILGVLVVGRAAVDAFEAEDLELVRDAGVRLGLALDGALLGEAHQRVMKLQEALLAEGEVLGRRGELPTSAARYLEVLAESVGAPSCGLIYRFADRASVRLFMMYTRPDGHTTTNYEAQPIDKCPLLARHANEKDVLVLDVASMLAAEREDPVIAPLLTDEADCLVLVPSGVEGYLAGWIAITLPLSFRISTRSEVEVLRNLGQQSRLALGTVLAQGRLGEWRKILEAPGAP